MPAPSAAKYPSVLDDDTSLFKLSDRKSFTLANGITDTALAMTVNESCSGLTGNFFLAFATGEMVYVTSVDTSSKAMTIIRGSGGTSPTTHNTSEGMKMIVTAQIFEQFKRVIVAIEEELGTLAKSTFANVAARIADAERRLHYHTHDGTTDYGPRIDADTVDTYHATATPAASKVVVSDTGGKVDGWITTASDTAPGIAELATIAETNTGTDAARAVTPDGLAGSNFGTRVVYLCVIDGATAPTVTAGLGSFTFFVPAELNGMNLVNANVCVQTASSSGLPTFRVWRYNGSASNSMLSTSASIDVGEYESRTGATPVVIDTGYDDVHTGDRITFECTAVGTSTKGVSFMLSFRLP